ncbi:MAG TPA: ABC transporter permease [Candidatus Angelobacter sp.]
MNWFQQLFARHRLHQDLSDEIREHIEEKTEELIAAGMTREEAAATARREFGNVLLQEERSRDVWRWPALDTVFLEFKHAFRYLRRSPGFTLTVIATLMLAIGVNTAVFTIVDALLLRPLPYPEPNRLASVVTNITGESGSGLSTGQDGETWELVRDHAPSVQAAAYKLTSNGVNLQAGASIRYVHEQRVSAEYFDVLAIHPILGSVFTHEEDLPDGPKAVLLSYELWNSVFNADPEILGKTILLKGEPYTVVGVLPAGTKTTAPADLWTPLRPKTTGEGEGINYALLVRLKDGVSWAQVDTELGRLRPHRFALWIGNRKMKMWLYAMPLQRHLASSGGDAVLILMCAVGFILLIACTNLAGLLLVRVMQRGPEIATRMALGATRATIVRQLMLEPLILAVAGGVAGVILAAASLDSLSKLLSSDVRFIGALSLDSRTLVFTAVATLCATLLIALLPLLELRRTELGFSRTTSGRSVAHSGRRRTRQTLIAAEVALTIVLLAGAGLLIRTLVYLETKPSGFDPQNVMTAQASLNDARYHDAAAFQKLVRESVAAMEKIPGVKSAAMGLTLPQEQALNTGVTLVDLPGKPQYISNEVYVTPEYFSTLQIPVLSGRTFTEGDTAVSQPVCVVSQKFAQRFLNGMEAVGRHLETEGMTYEIVGIVGDVQKPPGLSGGAPLLIEQTFYIPATQTNQGALNMYHVWFQPSWIVRTPGPIGGLTAAMQRALAEADPALPFSGFHQMRDFQNEALDRQRMEVFLLSVLAGLALVLSIIGVYGLVSSLVTQRTREIGIRMALGSTLRRTMFEIGKSGVIAAAAGIVVGLALSAVTARLIEAELYGVRPYDPVTFILSVLLLLTAALIASLAPTVRIARIDPASTLRAE